MQFLKHLDGFLRRRLIAADGYFGVNNLLHAAADESGILQRHGMADVEIDVVAVRHGNVYRHLALLIEVVDGLAQYEEQRAGVSPQS